MRGWFDRKIRGGRLDGKRKIFVSGHGIATHCLIHEMGLIGDEWVGFKNASITQIRYSEGKWRMMRLNYYGHLAAVARDDEIIDIRKAVKSCITNLFN